MCNMCYSKKQSKSILILVTLCRGDILVAQRELTLAVLFTSAAEYIGVL